MDCNTGDIFHLDKYDHIRTGIQKRRFAVVLVPKEITELVPNNCSDCSDNCGIYTSPLEKPVQEASVLFEKSSNYSWLDMDRYCHIMDSNLQQSCKQSPRKMGTVTKKDAKKFFDQLKYAFRANLMVGRDFSDPNFRGVVIQQWEDFAK